MRLLKPNDVISFKMVAGGVQNGEVDQEALGGEFEFAVAEVGDRNLEVKLARLGIYSAKLTFWQGMSGELSIASTFGEGRILRESSSVEINLEADVAFAELTEDGYKNLVSEPNGSRVPLWHKFTGTLSGSIEEPSEATSSWRLRGARLTLQSESHANLEVVLEAVGSVFTESKEGCPQSRLGRGGTVLVRPILFHNSRLNPVETGRSFDFQLRWASSVWSRCCLHFVRVTPPIIVQESAARTSGNPQAIVRSVQGKVVGKAVHVFVVDNLARGDGGGIQEGNTLIIEDKNVGNPVLLAHELGHIMHLNDVSSPDIMRPSGGPSQPGTFSNKLANCRVTARFTKLTSVRPCCWPP